MIRDSKTQGLLFVVTLFCFLFLILVLPKPTYAVWDGLPYSPGETYNPECLPSENNCDVLPSLASDNNLSDLTSSSTARANLGLGSLAELNDLSTFDTDDLAEGNNKFFSDTLSRNSISSDVEGILFSTTTGIFSLDSDYKIPFLASTTDWNTAFNWGDHSLVGYLTSITGLNISDLINDSGYLTSFTELDPIYSAWDKSTGISITESQISNLQNYLLSETDPIYSGSSWFSTTNNSTDWNTAFGWGDHGAIGYLTSYTETDPLFMAASTTLSYQPIGSYLTSETDPIYSAWDKSTGISITESQISDLGTYLTSYTETDPVFIAHQANNITASDITKLGNLSGTNTGDQDLSGLVPYTGATTDLDLGAYNLSSTRNFTGLGTALLPAYSFTGDTNTGMWSPTADTLAWSTGGSERMRITSAGSVGIGTTTPTAKLSVAGTTRIDSDLRLYGTVTTSNYSELQSTTDTSNGSLDALYIVPPVNQSRIFFGRSGKTAYSLNFANVSSFESVPATISQAAGTANGYSVSQLIGSGDNLVLSSQTYSNNGYISSPTSPTAARRQMAFRFLGADSDTYKRSAGFIFTSATTTSAWTSPHTIWSANNETTTLMTLSATGSLGIATSTPTSKLTLGSGQIEVPLGTVSVPSYSFSGDLNTGIFSGSADNLQISIGGTTRMQFTSAGNVFLDTATQVRIPSGSVASPGLSFGAAAADAGIYRLSGSTLGISTAGTSRMFFDASGNVGIGTSTPGYALTLGSGQMSAPIGSASAPSYSFNGFANQGMYSVSTNVLGFSQGGTVRFQVFAAGIEGSAQVRGLAVSAATPTFVPSNDTNTGVFFLGSDVMGLATGGTEAFRINASQNTGFGTGATVSARVHVVSTTEQFRSGYDASNYLSITTGSTGVINFNAVGTAPGIRFSNFGAGTLTTDASGNLSVSSDERFKNIQGEFDRGLSDLIHINPILYKWNRESGLEQNSVYAGFSAQNVQEFVPEAVGEDSRGFLTLQDRPLIAMVINAVKEINTKVDSMFDGLADLYVKTIKAKDQICIGETCIDEATLLRLLENDTTEIQITEGQSSNENGSNQTNSDTNSFASSTEELSTTTESVIDETVTSGGESDSDENVTPTEDIAPEENYSPIPEPQIDIQTEIQEDSPVDNLEQDEL